MANQALEITAAYLASRNIKYTQKDDRVLQIGFRLDNKDNIQVLVFFGEDSCDVSLKAFDFVKVPESKLATVYETCNEMNAQYRWAKFYVDKSDNTVTVQEDGVITLDTCGEEVYELVMRMANISDEAYPNFMRAIFA